MQKGSRPDRPGISATWPIDVGQSSSGAVFRQDYEQGVAIANLGDDDAEVVLEHPYYDLTNKIRTAVWLPAHTAEVLRTNPV